MSGAEIVERDLRAELPQMVQRISRQSVVAQEHGFGDLEHEAARRKPRRCDRAHDGLDDATATKLERLKVHGDERRSGKTGDLSRGLAQDPFADGLDDADLFRDRDEQRGLDLAALRALPTDQRLETL